MTGPGSPEDRAVTRAPTEPGLRDETGAPLQLRLPEIGVGIGTGIGSAAQAAGSAAISCAAQPSLRLS